MFFDKVEKEVREGYDVLDGCYATVKDTCRSGAFLRLDNGEDAFAYRFSHLTSGTKVLCTVLKLEDESHRKLVSIDSVSYPLAA